MKADKTQEAETVQSDEQPQQQAAPSTRKSPLFEPFFYEAKCRLDVEKAIRSVGFLLQWMTEEGNEPVPGRITSALGEILDHAADEVCFEMYDKGEVSRAGFHPDRIVRDKA